MNKIRVKRYYMFSLQQKKEMYGENSKSAMKVYHNGKYVEYTAVVDDPNNYIYSDGVLVAIKEIDI